MGTKAATTAKKPQPAAPAKKPGLAAVNNKGKATAKAPAKPPTKPKAAAPVEKKRERVTHPEGTEQVFVLADGTEVPSIWKGEVGEEQLCCQACQRKFPVRAQAVESAIKRKTKLVSSSQQTFRHFARMFKKNAARLGEPVPSNEEIAALMLEAANEEDVSIEEEVEAEG